MKRPLVTTRALQDRRVSLTWWGVGILAYVSMIIAVWPIIDGNADFEELLGSYPDSVKAMMGGAETFDAFTTPWGFLSSYLYSLFLPFILLGLAVALGSALLAGDEEDGLLELLLSYPVTRTSAVTQKALAMVLALLAAAVLVVAAIALGSALVDLDIGVGALMAATIGTLLYAVMHGQLAMLAGAATGRKGTAVGIGWGVALAGYVVNVVAGLDPSLAWLGRLSPLNAATANEPLNNGMPVEYLLLVALCVLLLGCTYAVFDRHDLR